MKVFIPSALRSYTATAQVQAEGTNLAELLHDLDQKYPGIRFRIVDEQDALRRHLRIFINRDEARDLNTAVVESDEVHILQALSGG